MATLGRILIVDDDPGHQGMVRRSLAGIDADIDVAGTGQSALAQFAKAGYDLVVLDLMLPDTNGVGVLCELLTSRPETQVVVLSAADDSATRVQCLELGAVDFVGKPFDLAEFNARARTRLKAVDRRFLRVGAVTLDRQRQQVITQGRSCSLAPREFGLLHHLMCQAGEVCTRSELLTRVWGFPQQSDTAVVDVYVWRLRHKLPPDQIETVRSVGYSFALT